MIFVLDDNFKAKQTSLRHRLKTGVEKMMIKCILSAVLIKTPQNISQLY